MAGDKVGVKVSEENVADPEAKFLSVGQVLLDVALRVDDDGGRTGLVSDQIGGVGQATQVILFQNHWILYYLPAARLSTRAALYSLRKGSSPARFHSFPVRSSN